ncbi:hypothetical protein RND81_08G154400 [Saponaria officinalis]|uniref:Ubiquitin-like protease family profile domain-containing protein n=1 Tax=Saponaria officinalis TaxID=3572 RepID=A0AAW1J7X3_SAPOF
MKSDRNKDEFIMAPIYNSNHWMLLVICPQTYTIYEFDPITRKEGRELYMKMVVSSALRRYKLSGGHLKVTRREPLWKSVKCPQQTKGVEYGFFVLRYMFDIVKSCTTSNDLDKVWSSRSEHSYTNREINEIQDKWAKYFTNHCVS